MASGDTLVVFSATEGIPPASNYATQDLRNVHPVLDFDDSTDETAYFEGFLPRNYAGGGLTVTLIWAATSATSGTCRWSVAIERQDTGTDLDGNSFATAQTTGGAASATSGKPTYTTIAFTAGTQMDNLAAGEAFRLDVTRDADGTSGTDDMTGDAELLRVEIKET